MGKSYFELIQEQCEIKPEEMARTFMEQRMLMLHGRIHEEGASALTDTLIKYDFKQQAPILLLINSNGGDVVAADHIIQTINMINSPVHALVIGEAKSMAIDILLACKERKGVSRSRYFMHFTRTKFEIICDEEATSEKSLRALKDKICIYKKLREGFYADRLKKPIEEVQRLFQMGERLKYEYTAEQAKELGLITDIVTDFKFFPKKEVPT